MLEMVTTRDPHSKRQDHPNLIHFIDYYQEPGASKWLVLEYMRGDWLNNVVARNRLEEVHVARITAEVCMLSLGVNDWHLRLHGRCLQGVRWIVLPP